ncbi:MAG: signal peptidase I [Microgenomates group bacterium]|jgi:signal peptidase
MKKIGNIFYWICLTLLIFVAIATAFTVLEAPGGYRLFLVRSGSMEPAVKTGSIVLVAPQTKYSAGDIVTFLNKTTAKLKDPNSTTTHRITKVSDDEGRPTYQTKGDANRSADMESITQRQILGKVLLVIPLIGYLIAFTKTQVGFIAFIIVPITLIIFSELLTIKKETQRLMSERKSRKLTAIERVEEKIGEEIIKIKKVTKKKTKNKK